MYLGRVCPDCSVFQCKFTMKGVQLISAYRYYNVIYVKTPWFLVSLFKCFADKWNLYMLLVIH